MDLTDGSGGPPPDWDPTEATERIKKRSHATPEHKRWLQGKNEEGEMHTCSYCSDREVTE